MNTRFNVSEHYSNRCLRWCPFSERLYSHSCAFHSRGLMKNKCCIPAMLIADTSDKIAECASDKIAEYSIPFGLPSPSREVPPRIDADGAKIGQDGAKMEPKGAKMGPKWAQDEAKMAPNGAQIGPRRHPHGPRWRSDGPSRTQKRWDSIALSYFRALSGPNGSNMGPKIEPKRAKIH